MFRLVGGHFGELQSLHQAVHSSDTDVDAIITLKNEGNFVCTKPFVVIGINMEDQGSNALILSDARSRFSRKMLIIGASVNSQNPTERFDVMLEPEFMDSV